MRQGDVVVAEFKGLDPTNVCMPLAVTLSGGAQQFASTDCKKHGPGLYINGTKSKDDLLSQANAFATQKDKADLRIVSEDSLSDDIEMDLLNPVWHERIIERINNTNDLNALIFDHSAALLKGPIDEKSLAGLHRFITRLRQLQICQVWAVRPQKKMEFPSDLATIIWRVSPGPEIENQTINLEILRDTNKPYQAPRSILVEVMETPEGILELRNRNADRNDRYTALVLVQKGRSQTQIAETLGYDQSTIHHWFKDFKERNLMRQSGHTYSLTSYGEKYLQNHDL